MQSFCVLSSESLPVIVTGGTDIVSCFMGQNPSLPVYKGEIQARNLAMAVEAWDEEGRPLLCRSLRLGVSGDSEDEDACLCSVSVPLSLAGRCPWALV